MDNQLVTVSEIQSMANAMGKSGLFGKTPEQFFGLMLLAQAQGRHPALVATEYDIIQGKPAINSKSALAKFQQAGGSINWIERTDSICSAKFYHAQGGELTITWTMERAKQAQLTGKDNWKKFPCQMLSARVVSEGVRAVFPACLDGLYTSEEVADFDPPKWQKQEPVVTESKEVPTLEDSVFKMLSFMDSQGISEDQVLAKLERYEISQITDDDLAFIRQLIQSSKDLRTPISLQFPEIEKQDQPNNYDNNEENI